MSAARAPRPRINAALVGKSYGESTYEVRAEAIEAYARATNDLNARYLARPDAVAGPVWPIVPAFGFVMAAARDPDLGVDLRRLLHASEHHVLHAPIRSGEVLTLAGSLSSIEHADNGDLFTVAVTERRADGSLAAEVWATMFVRGAGRASRRHDDPGERRTVHTSVVHVDDDQMRRYADASGDRNPIHLDPRAARLAGLRAPILHGMCTMAMATKGAVDGLARGDPTAVRSVAVTFARPVAPGQDLTTRFWPADRSGCYGLETTDGTGARVLEGEVELR